MLPHFARGLVPSTALVVSLAATSIHAQSRPVQRVSVSSAGVEGDRISQTSGVPSISADGRYVVFESSARNLVAGDTNNINDVFVHDRVTATTTRINVSSGGIEADRNCYDASMSADGNLVVFTSGATNLIPMDQNFTTDILVHDRSTGATFAVNVNDDGDPAQWSGGTFNSEDSKDPAISADGRFVVFSSLARNLILPIGTDDNNASDIFMRDLVAGTTRRVNIGPTGAIVNGAIDPHISADGRKITFLNSNRTAVYVRDFDLRETRQLVLPFGVNTSARLSASGRYVLLTNNSGLIPSDTNGVADVYLYDTDTDVLERVSLTESGGEPNSACQFASMSGDARHIVYSSFADNIVAGDTNGFGDVFLHDREAGTTQRISLSEMGAEGDGISGDPSLSADGRHVVYESRSSNLVAGDTNGQFDVFVTALSKLDCVDAASTDAAGMSRYVLGTQLATDPEVLRQPGERRVGAACDGTARLLLQFHALEAGDLTVAFRSPDVGAGSVAVPGGPFGQTPLQIPLVATSDGFKAFFVYRAPDNFVRPGQPADATDARREIAIDVDFQPSGSAQTFAFHERIELRRPPVAFCHGLWSSRFTWQNAFENLSLGGDERFEAWRVDYSVTAADAYIVNFPVVDRSVRILTERLRRDEIASARIDWVGHSMGGILPRYHYRQAVRGHAARPWSRADNFGDGDLRKLVLINSPQWGSPWANIMTALRDDPTIGVWFAQAMRAIDKPVDRAIDDLREGSAAFAYIDASPLRAHSIVGVGFENLLALGTAGIGVAAAVAPPPWNAVLRTAAVVSDLTIAAIYRGERHDLIVLEASQRAGLPSSVVTVFSDALNANHLAVTGWDPIHDRVVELLDAPMAEFSASMPAPDLTPADDLPMPGPLGATGPVVRIGDLQLVDLGGGAPVQPGATVSLRVDPLAGFVPTSVDVLAAWDIQSTATSPFQVQFTVPITAVGAVSFFAVAEDAAAARAVSLVLTIPVDVPAALVSLATELDGVELFAPLQRHRIQVLGSFQDGVVRDVSAAIAGTTYTVADPSIASVSADGEVLAHRQGTTTVQIQNGSAMTDFVVTLDYGGPARKYGESLAGAGGELPVLDAIGAPAPGNPNFVIRASAVTGGAFGTIFLAALPDDLAVPLFGARIAVDFGTTVPFSVTANGPAGQPGAGSADLALSLPNDPALIGQAIFSQGFFADPGAALGLSHTQGLAITFVP